MVHEFAIVNDRPQGDTVYRVAVNEDFQHDEVVNVEPLVRQKFRNVVRQAMTIPVVQPHSLPCSTFISDVTSRSVR